MKKINLIVIAFVCLIFIACEKKVSKFEIPKQLISNEQAKDLSQRYITERARIISVSINKTDANSAWYSIEELKNYLNYVETEGNKNGIKVNGVRFYLGVYPQNITDPNVTKEKSGLTTIFLVPTTKIDSKNVAQKSGLLKQSIDENGSDVAEIAPLNYGGMGHPPITEYLQN